MKRIAAINGSPKAAGSVSGMLIEKMEEILDVKIDVFPATKLIRSEKAPETIAAILEAEVLLIVFPLYVDSLPAPLIKLLMLIQQSAKASNSPLPVVYAICNCGFYEAEHNTLALRMLRCFADRAGLGWGYGIGIGCGGFLSAVSKNIKKGPAANVYEALYSLCETIRINDSKERGDVLVTPKIPRFLYRLAGEIGWLQMARKNGVLMQLNVKPHAGTK